jgi:hypothetical protein
MAQNTVAPEAKTPTIMIMRNERPVAGRPLQPTRGRSPSSLVLSTIAPR